MKHWVQDKQEVEVVDMILRIRNKLEQSEAEELPLSDTTREQLRLRMADIICTLPDDLKVVLKTSWWCLLVAEKSAATPLTNSLNNGSQTVVCNKKGKQKKLSRLKCC